MKACRNGCEPALLPTYYDGVPLSGAVTATLATLSYSKLPKLPVNARDGKRLVWWRQQS